MNDCSISNFYGKIGVDFCSNTAKCFVKSKGSSENGIWDFQNSPPFERLACFHVTLAANFECYQYFNFEINFLKNENLFQKSGVPF